MQRLLWLVPSLFTAALSAQNAAPALFAHTFGERGAAGSFLAQFSELGAGVVWLQLGDHYVDAAATARAAAGEPVDDKDRLLLLWSGNDHSFRVEEQPGTGKPRFDGSLLLRSWQHTVTADAVQFETESGGLVLRKTFRLRPGRELALELALENKSDAAQDGSNRLQLRLGGPAVLNRVEPAVFLDPAVAIAVGADRKLNVQGPSPGKLVTLLEANGQGWSVAGSTNRYFGAFLFPLDDACKQCVQRVSVATLPPVEDPVGQGLTKPTLRVLLDLALAIPKPGAATNVQFGLYLGPKSPSAFADEEHQRFQPVLDHDLDPPCYCITVPGGRQMAWILMKALSLFHGVIGSWGIAIMMLTVVVRCCLLPVNYRMQKSMRAYGAKMAVLKPKMDQLKKRFADDPKRYQEAMLQFQRENKLMPPLAGCLPVFLTMPIYLGLFTALRTAYELRHQPFLVFIHDLSQSDALFALSFWPGHFNILPLCWIAMLVTLQLRTPLPTDPQQRTPQLIARYMPILFGVMLYNYAAGLMVYMVTSMLWTFVESAMIKRKLGPIDPNAAALAPTPMM